MSQELALPATADPADWTPQEKALITFVGAVNAPRPVVEAFLAITRRTGLDPIAKQIYCIELSGKWCVVVGIDGFRLTAQRSGQYTGQEHPAVD